MALRYVNIIQHLWRNTSCKSEQMNNSQIFSFIIVCVFVEQLIRARNLVLTIQNLGCLYSHHVRVTATKIFKALQNSNTLFSLFCCRRTTLIFFTKKKGGIVLKVNAFFKIAHTVLLSAFYWKETKPFTQARFAGLRTKFVWKINVELAHGNAALSWRYKLMLQHQMSCKRCYLYLSLCSKVSVWFLVYAIK